MKATCWTFIKLKQQQKRITNHMIISWLSDSSYNIFSLSFPSGRYCFVFVFIILVFILDCSWLSSSACKHTVQTSFIGMDCARKFERNILGNKLRTPQQRDN
jgi:hypothetical protein